MAEIGSIVNYAPNSSRLSRPLEIFRLPGYACRAATNSTKEQQMTTYAYTAVDSQGRETKGSLHAADQNQALQRLKQMGFFPVKLTAAEPLSPAARAQRHAFRLGLKSASARGAAAPFRGRIKSRRLAVFTRQLATLLGAGLPLPRSLRLLEEQETHPPLLRLIAEIHFAIEGGATFSEALSQYPRVFDPLYINMIKAGELGGMLDTSLQRLADFTEKAGRIKGKVKAAMVYPAAVGMVAAAVVTLMTLFIIPKFKEVFLSLGEGRPLPWFTRFVFGIADEIRIHCPIMFGALMLSCLLFLIAIRTRAGRELLDRIKLKAPAVGPVFRKLAITRFARTLGALLGSGVPILQALNIVREATGNVIVGRVVRQVHESVKQGESIAPPLRQSGVFPAMVAGMVDVGEQTGALPEMLNKVADGYDAEVDDAIAAMLSLFEPVTIVILAVLVGSVVIAMFLPLVGILDQGVDPAGGHM
jgi:type IV pilus assembly protein PilC